MLFVTFTGKKEMATFAPLDFLLALRKKNRMKPPTSGMTKIISMRFLLPTFLLAALGSFVTLNAGAGHSKVTAPVDVFMGADLTAADLASALKMHWWNLEIPENFNDEMMLGICFKDEDGISRRSGGSTGWEPGSSVKVFLMDLDKEKLRFAIIAPGRSLTGSIPNELFNLGDNSATSYIGVGSTVSLEKILVRRAEGGVTDRELRKGEIGIAVSAESLH